MKKTATAKTIASIAACMLAGALSLQCGPTQPVGVGSNGGSGGGGVTGTVLSTGAAGGSMGGNASGGHGPIISFGGQSGTAGTAGSMQCGSAAICTPTSCGNIIDDCGTLISCGYTNCAISMCNLTTNECTPCTSMTPADYCASIGKNCGPMQDNCGRTIDCGTCTPPDCCGCGGVASVCAGDPGGNSYLAQPCIAGQRGCLCDDRGACAAGLTCTPQAAPRPSICCNGADCSQLTNGIGGSCPGTATAGCTPGVTIPAETSTLDTCGYVATTFDESTILCGIFATGGGKDPAQIQGFFQDEKSMTLGCATTTSPVSAMPSNPGAVYYPQVGDPNCVDGTGRPMRPALYITDITYDPNCRAGDQQSGGTPYDPVAAFGTWKSAAVSATGKVGTPGPDPTPKNYWNLGSAADPVPAGAANVKCPCTAASCPGTGHNAKGFGTEFKYEAGLISGHSYRIQITAHDGDQTSGADAGEACVIFCAGTGICVPLTCANYPTSVCGPQPDGCGGSTADCPCCQKLTCANYPRSVSGPQDDGCGGQTPYCNWNQ
jgi:hypothetical protein